jgi:protein involved in polysaccharide export with SLBB domain
LLQPDDVILVQTTGLPPGEELNDSYYVDPSGIVDLGPPYGRAKVGGLNLLDAENAIKEHLRQRGAVTDFSVQVVLVAGRKPPEPSYQATNVPTAATAENTAPRGEVEIEPYDVIRIQVLNAFPDQPISGDFWVEPMGTVALGPSYGRVKVAGMTVLEAEEAIMRHLADIIENPVLQVENFQKSGLPRTQQSAADGATGRLSPGRLSEEWFQQAVVAQIIELQRQLKKLEAENAELTSQLHGVRDPAPDIGFGVAEQILQPGERIKVGYDTKAVGINSGPQFFTLNRDGEITIELGGGSPLRTIRIGGMDARQAAEKIDNEVGHLIDNIRVERVTAPR